MNMKGTFEIQYTDDWSGFWQSVNGSVLGAITSAILSLPSGAPKESGNVSMDLVYPQHFQTGISVDVHPKLTLNADIGWTDYKQWDAFVFRFDRNLEFLNAARILSPDNATPNTLRLPLGFRASGTGRLAWSFMRLPVWTCVLAWKYGIRLSRMISDRLWRHLVGQTSTASVWGTSGIRTPKLT